MIHNSTSYSGWIFTGFLQGTSFYLLLAVFHERHIPLYITEIEQCLLYKKEMGKSERGVV